MEGGTAREGEGRSSSDKMKLKGLRSTLKAISALSHSLTVLREEGETERESTGSRQSAVPRQASVAARVAKTR